MISDKITDNKNVIAVRQTSWDIFLRIRRLQRTVEDCPHTHRALCADEAHLQACNSN